MLSPGAPGLPIARMASLALLAERLLYTEETRGLHADPYSHSLPDGALLRPDILDLCILGPPAKIAP
jgi:hypothetical protein